MNSTLLIIKQSLKKRKKQYLFLSVTLFLSTILFAIAIHLISAVEKPFDDTFQALKASHLLLFFDATADDYNEIRVWYEQREEVARVSKPIHYTMFDRGFSTDGRRIRTQVHLTEYIRQDSQDSLVVLNPYAGDVPDYNEVWLPYHFSTNHDLRVGDTLQFQFESGSHDFLISSFVIDPHFLSGLFNPSRIFMAPGAMAMYQPLDKLNSLMVGIQMKEATETTDVYREYLSESGYSGTKLEYQLFKSAFTGVYSIFSSVLLLLSLMIFLLVLLLLNGTLSSQIYADLRQIGVFKTLGFTPFGIRRIYLFKLFLLSVLAIPIGLVIAHFFINQIFGYMNMQTGLNHTVSFDLNDYFLPGLLITVVIMLTTLYSSYKAGSVTAVQAIQTSKVRGRSRLKNLPFRNLPVEVIMGIRFLVSKPLSSFVLLFSFSVLTFLLVWVSGVSSSMEDIKTHQSDWGFLDTDLHISLQKNGLMPLDKKAFLTLLPQVQQSTEQIIPFSYTNLKIIHDATVREERGVVYDFDLSEAGFRNLSGSHPYEASEIALATGTASNIGVDTGDSIKVWMEGSLRQMKVCGIYQDASTFGQGFRLHASALRYLNPLFDADQFGIALTDAVDINRAKNTISSFFGEKIEVQESIEQRGAFLSILANLRIGVWLIALFFILILSILVANDLHIHIFRERTTIAKMKGIGFTNAQVKSAFLFKHAILILSGILTGILLNLMIGKVLISSLTAGIGLLEFPFKLHVDTLAWLSVIILSVGYLSARNAMHITTRILPIHLNVD